MPTVFVVSATKPLVVCSILLYALVLIILLIRIHITGVSRVVLQSQELAGLFLQFKIRD
jgi:hypothetical protein